MKRITTTLALLVVAAVAAAAIGGSASAATTARSGNDGNIVETAQIGLVRPLGAASDNFYGRGQMTIANTSQQVLTLYVPVGALFPPTTAGEQRTCGASSWR